MSQLETRPAWQRLLFEQNAAFRRLARVRIAVAGCVATLVLFGPFGDFFVDNSALYLKGAEPRWWLPVLGPAPYAALRLLALASAITLALGIWSRTSAVLAALSFFLLNGYTSHFTPGLFNYDTHLNFFLLALACVDSGRHLSLDARARARAGRARAGRARAGRARAGVLVEERESFVLGAMQVFVALLYWQAFIAKLVFGGFEWFTQGEVIFVHALRFGTPIGQALANLPELFPVMGIGTGAFELGVGFAFLKGGRAARWATVFAIGFHVGVWLVLGISFFHLMLVLPTLFFGTAPTARASTGPLDVAGSNACSPAMAEGGRS